MDRSLYADKVIRQGAKKMMEGYGIDLKVGNLDENFGNFEGANTHIISHFHRQLQILLSSDRYVVHLSLIFASLKWNVQNEVMSKAEFQSAMINSGQGDMLKENYIEQQSEFNNSFGQLHFDLELFSLRGLMDPTFVYEELIPLFSEVLANSFNDKNEFVFDLPEYKNIVARLGYQIALLICRHCETEEMLIKNLKKAPTMFVSHLNKIRNYALTQVKSKNYENKALQFAYRFGVTSEGRNDSANYRISAIDLERLNRYCDPLEEGNVGREIFVNSKRIAKLPSF